MNTHLTTTWRDRADEIRRLTGGAANDAARIWEMAADEWEEHLDRYLSEPLNLQDASRESGYSAGHLGRLVREGEIPNAGRPNAPLVRRGDLPLKAGRLRRRHQQRETPRSSRTQIARSIVDSDAKEANDG